MDYKSKIPPLDKEDDDPHDPLLSKNIDPPDEDLEEEEEYKKHFPVEKKKNVYQV